MTRLTPTATEKHSENLITRRSVLLLVVMLVVVAIVPMALDRVHSPVPFDQSVVESFSESKAEIVFLGNSLLDTRIDPDLLGELTNSDVASLAIDGTAPGIWYLQMANVVAEVEQPPGQIFVFFHDDLITRPMYFTGVEDQLLKESLTPESVQNYGTLPSRNESFTEKFSSVFESLYPLVDFGSSRTSNPISSIARRAVGMNEEEATRSTEKVFGFANKRDQSSIIQQPKYHGTFDSMNDDSFLPLFIEIAGDIGSEITFVRVAARPNDDGSPNEPESLAAYSADLDAYLTNKNIRYIDMTSHIDEGAIDAAMYFDGYHLKNRFRQHYTEFFAEWMNSSIGLGNHSGSDQ